MIKSLETIALDLENDLNRNIGKLNEIYKNIRFEFYIAADTTDYKPFVREGNTVTFYINGVMSVIDSVIEGTDKNANNASISVFVDLLIPAIDSSNKKKTTQLFNGAREIIDQTLALNKASTETIDGIPYFVSSRYKLASTGTREIRPRVGDSLSLSFGIEYSFVALGISSDLVKITVDGESVLYSNLGISRRTLIEGNVSSSLNRDADTPSSAGAVSGTSLVINMAMPTRLTKFDQKVASYLLKSKLPEMSVEIIEPTQEGDITTSLKMIFSSAALNGQIGLNASTEVELVEKI